ncbi:MAG: MotA/TolQ/ExbB proton channel family protein [Kiritimatiellae bacterium]|nr:MotA/TolQ/ExbB proton channel family protein [Kiritimatiellia bacterium]MDW8457909.1 MotA/TolQ/ExbB proton channel family protein [Verrucomicrobiota bacterium]
MSEPKVSFPSGERPGTSVNMGLVVLLAIGMDFAVLGAIYTLEDTFLRDLFMGRTEIDTSRLVFQGLTMFMFCLSTMTVLLKRVKIRAEFRALRDIPLPDDLDMTDLPRLVGVYNEIAEIPKWEKRMVYTRVMRVLAMWINSRDLERTSQYARENSEMDVFASDASFRANRLFIWAMPLLGFLGTVYGVSYGIGGFAEFLRGDVSAEDIKFQVGLITQGLAVAFYTTLVGLWTAGAAAFPSMAAERREEQLLGEIDALIEERLTSRMPSIRKTEFPVEAITAMREDIGHMAEALSAPLRDLIASIEDGFRRLPSPQRYEEVFAQAITRASDMINDKYSQFQIRYEVRIGELGEQLAARLQDVSERFRLGAEMVANRLEGQARAIEQSGARAVEQQAAAVQSYLATLDQASEREAARWKEVSDDLRRQVGDASEQLGRAVQSLREATSLAAKGADEAARGLAEQMTRLIDVGTRIESLLQATRAVEVAMADIAGSVEFRAALADLRRHLQTTDDLIRRLSKPRQIILTEARAG